MKSGSEREVAAVPDETRLADQLARSEANQKTLNALLRLSLEDLELEELLRRALTLVLDNPWPATLGVGAVFLVDHESNELVLKAHNGLGAPVLERCARVPFGTCLCGRVASTRQPLHTPALCDVHEVSYANMLGHGHYCIPIAAGGTLLGVLNVYLREGHPYDAREEAFLGSFTSTLAGMVVRKRAEENVRLTQEQLLHSQKMEAVGRLAGGIAHDFNNLLQVILGLGEIVLDEVATQPRAHAGVTQMIQAATQAAGLTGQLLALGRRQPIQATLLDLNRQIEQLEPMLRRVIGEDIELRARLAAAPLPVCSESSWITQVAMNLVVNARDAMPNGGVLVIETARERRMTAEGGQAEFARLTVTDTGIGMEESVRRRMFEPYFTTKEKGRGSGLGLSVAYGIVKQSGGDIAVRSEPGKGTTFDVYFPWAENCGCAEAAAAPARTCTKGTETIVVVEDEADVRQTVEGALGRLGYRVIAAASGAEALAIFDGPADVHLVLTDVTMPLMSGPQLVERLRARRPALSVLYMSGHIDGSSLDAVDGSALLLRKPFTTDALATAVRQALDASN